MRIHPPHSLTHSLTHPPSALIDADSLVRWQRLAFKTAVKAVMAWFNGLNIIKLSWSTKSEAMIDADDKLGLQ